MRSVGWFDVCRPLGPWHTKFIERFDQSTGDRRNKHQGGRLQVRGSLWILVREGRGQRAVETVLGNLCDI